MLCVVLIYRLRTAQYRSIEIVYHLLLLLLLHFTMTRSRGVSK